MNEAGRVHALLDAGAEPPGGPVLPPVAELLARARTGRRRRRVGLVSLVAIGCALIIAVPFVVIRNGGRPLEEPAVYPSVRSATAAELARGRWDVLPQSPVPGRIGAAAVWTGDEMVVWGGASGTYPGTLRADGVAYEPGTRTWRMLPPSPLGARSGTASVWTGHAMFVWGGYDSLYPLVVSTSALGGIFAPGHATNSGALYDPDRRTWQVLPRSPLLGGLVSARALWTGREVVVVGGRPPGRGNSVDVVAAAYNPTSHSWRMLPPLPPLGLRVSLLDAVGAGDRIYLWLGHLGAGVDMLEYDSRGNVWDSVSGGRDSKVSRGLGGPLWTGDELIVPAAVAYRPTVMGHYESNLYGERLVPGTGDWRAMAHGPLDDRSPLSIWTGGALLSLAQGGGAAVWDPAADTWTRLPDAPVNIDEAVLFGSTIWTGRQVLLWGPQGPPVAFGA
ncbi:MAG: hypothetical protein J2P15_13440 [Micromonosporaceae bacterium]|nr:hypothetical protein [Micromonosporaceae bacterium]